MGQLNSNHPVLLSLVLSLCFIGNAWGEVEVDYRGYLEVDNRFSVPGKKEPAGISETRFLRSDATARLTLAVGEGDVQGVVDLATVFTGFKPTP